MVQDTNFPGSVPVLLPWKDKTIADSLMPLGRTTPESQQMVESSAFEFENMERYLQSGRFTDLKVICGCHSFRVHRLVVDANCSYFKGLLSGKARKRDEIVLDDDEILPRLPGSYPTTHIARLKIKSFSKLSDSHVETGRLNLLHAKMFCVGIDYDVPELRYAAAQAFRSLGHQDFCRDSDWPALANYIYTSTLPKYRDLRDVVVRELLYATHNDRARFKMRDLNSAIKKTPGLAVDLATITLTKQTFRCEECNHDQYLLVLSCSHKTKHETYDSDCFKSCLKELECSNCHDLDVFG